MRSRIAATAFSVTFLAPMLGSFAQAQAASRMYETRSAGQMALCSDPRPDVAHCFSLLRTDAVGKSSPIAYGPKQLQAAYKLPSSTMGNGQTVAIVDAFNDPSAELELARFRLFYGLPACSTSNGCFLKVNQEGQQGNYPLNDEGWAVEEALDIEMVSAICPNCHITLVEANSATSSDLSAAEKTAVGLGNDIVSNSWGCSPYYCTINPQDFNYPGVVITAGSGDNGYGGLYFPAALGTVVTVGGTRLVPSNGQRGWLETAWSGAGSACSTVTKPTWQRDIGCAFRIYGDVSAVADPNTGVSVFSMWLGGWSVIGGTSVATPIIASVYALAGNASSQNAAEGLYQNPKTELYDVAGGSTGQCIPAYFCTAVKGYDGPTGNGTPHGIGAF